MKLKRLLVTKELHDKMIALRKKKNEKADFHKFSLTELSCDAVAEYLDRQKEGKK